MPGNPAVMLLSVGKRFHACWHATPTAGSDPGVQGAQFQGEFGPASGGLQTKSFLHSYSSTFGLIRPV